MRYFILRKATAEISALNSVSKAAIINGAPGK